MVDRWRCVEDHIGGTVLMMTREYVCSKQKWSVEEVNKQKSQSCQLNNQPNNKLIINSFCLLLFARQPNAA